MSDLNIEMMNKYVDVTKAYNSTDLKEFMELVFPKKWTPLIARIIESGATYKENDKFAPRWSTIPFTERKGKADIESQLKSIIFRVHDCLHQLWGLSTPDTFDNDEFYNFKRMWMCAEIAVLTITEFFFCQWLYDTQPHLREILEARNTLLFKATSPLRNKDMQSTAARLDELLHKKTIPKWVRDNPHGMIFIEDFVPMLEQDRTKIDCNWALLKQQDNKDYLKDLSNQRYSKDLDGLELTVWMIKDFEHLLNTGDEIDIGLAKFNANRRDNINLPDLWNQGIMPQM